MKLHAKKARPRSLRGPRPLGIYEQCDQLALTAETPEERLLLAHLMRALTLCDIAGGETFLMAALHSTRELPPDYDPEVVMHDVQRSFRLRRLV